MNSLRRAGSFLHVGLIFYTSPADPQGFGGVFFSVLVAQRQGHEGFKLLLDVPHRIVRAEENFVRAEDMNHLHYPLRAHRVEAAR